MENSKNQNDNIEHCRRPRKKWSTKFWEILDEVVEVVSSMGDLAINAGIPNILGI